LINKEEGINKLEQEDLSPNLPHKMNEEGGKIRNEKEGSLARTGILKKK